MSVEIGLKGRAEAVVMPENTAQAVGSGLAPVFATPSMIALMENAAAKAIQSCLEPDEGSVGTHIDVAHTAATPIGMKVWAEAEVVEAEGRKIAFAVAAFDEAGEIGRGAHERCVIKTERFLSRAQGRAENR